MAMCARRIPFGVVSMKGNAAPGPKLVSRDLAEMSWTSLPSGAAFPELPAGSNRHTAKRRETSIERFKFFFTDPPCFNWDKVVACNAPGPLLLQTAFSLHFFRVGSSSREPGPFRLGGCALRVERTALRRGDSGEFSSRGMRESRKIESPLAGFFLVPKKKRVRILGPVGPIFDCS